MSYEDLRKAVANDGGLHTTTMDVFKDLEGAGRLGVNVRARISRELASHGMGHFPADLPANQWETVRLYLLGSPIADVVAAVRRPGEKGDEILRSVASSDAQEKLRQIRDIAGG